MLLTLKQRRLDLKPWHIIVDQDTEAVVRAAIHNLKSSLQVTVKSAQPLTVDHEVPVPAIAEEKTAFLHMKIPSSLYSGPGSERTAEQRKREKLSQAKRKEVEAAEVKRKHLERSL